MGSLDRRLEALEECVGSLENPYAAARRTKVIWALNRMAQLRVRQRVPWDEIVLETEEDREAWGICEAMRERRERDGV